MTLSTLHILANIYGITMKLYQESELASESQELGPILEPDPIKFSFDAPGWYFLAIVLFLFFLFGFFNWVKQYRNNAYRRQAIKKLDQLIRNTNEIGLSQQVTEVLTVLKLVAVQTYGRKEVANLHGKPWFSFLDSKVKSHSFSEFEPIISKSVYQCIPMGVDELTAFKNLSKIWIRKHA